MKELFCIVILLFSNIILFFIAVAVYYYIGQCLHEIGHLIAGRRINPSNPAAIILFVPTLHKHKITYKNTTFYLIPSSKKSKDMSPIACFADCACLFSKRNTVSISNKLNPPFQFYFLWKCKSQ